MKNNVFVLVIVVVTIVGTCNACGNEHEPLCQNGPSPATSQLRQWMKDNRKKKQGIATNQEGIPMPSLVASQAIGRREHILLQDAFFLEKTASFNRERIPERVVHAKGAGAFGVFEVTDDVSHFTKAKVFNGIGKQTEVAVRFSTVGGEKGSGDTWTDPKGFATKFYTEDGIFDLVGNNLEMFPIRDPMLFPDVTRTRKRNPATHLRDPTMWWDFTSFRPEATLHTLHLFSDEGTPHGYRVMNGAGVHAFKWVNATNNPIYIKYHWISNQPYRFLSREESLLLAGTNPDYFVQDLYDAIARGEFPSWDLHVQIMTFEQAETHPQNPFDISKLWRREQFPLFRVGRMTLNRNPTDFFTQVELLAFTPANMVPGIEPSPDRMLHGRMFSYQDAQRYRLGVNFAQLPVNRAVSRLENYFRDGSMCFNDNGDGAPNYFPNSFGGLTEGNSGIQTSFPVSGDVDRIDITDEDYYSLPRMFIDNDIDAAQRARLVDNIAAFLSRADPAVQRRALQNLIFPVSQEFGNEMTEALQRFNRQDMKAS